MSIIMTLWTWFNNNSGAMTALATTVLAIVTYLYLKELRRQRKEMQTPIIEITPIKDGGLLSIAITNNGPGAALNVRSYIYGQQEGMRFLLYEDNRGRPLQSGRGFKYKLVTIPDASAISIEVHFEDVFGKDNEIKREIILSALQEWDKRESGLFEHFYGIN